jgi:hypothetical protein
MAITQTLTTSFKLQILEAVHDFTTDTFKIPLYTSAAILGPDTTVYTSSEEVTSAGYTAGGQVLTGVIVSAESGVAFVTFNNVTWSNVTFTARGALIYNSTTNASVAVLNFGSDKTTTNTFTVTFPTVGSTTSVITIS